METFLSLLTNPITITVIAFVLALGFMVSPYEIYFEDKEEIEI